MSAVARCDGFTEDCLILQVVEQVSKIQGVSKVLIADNEVFKAALPGTMEGWIQSYLRFVVVR